MKLLDQLIRYEHKEWIKLHKLHVSAASVLATTGIVAGIFLLSSGNSTTAASANTAYSQNKSGSQTSNNSTDIATATTQPTIQGSTNPSTGAVSTNSTHVSASTSTAPNKSAVTGATNSSTTSTPTTTTPAPTQPPTLEQQYPNDYPGKWATPTMDTVFDTWGMYNRESTSYTAWKVNETFGNMPTSWAGGYTNGTPSGNAKNWPQDAQNSGFTTSTTPKIHTVAIRLTGATGLSAWVEAVDDNNVTVSLYNNDGTGSYSVETVPAGLFSTYIYFN